MGLNKKAFNWIPKNRAISVLENYRSDMIKAYENMQSLKKGKSKHGDYIDAKPIIFEEIKLLDKAITILKENKKPTYWSRSENVN